MPSPSMSSAVVVADLVELLLLTPEVWGSNAVVDKSYQQKTVLKMAKVKKKWPN